MSICVVDGKQCQCQPDEGVSCPGVTALRAELARLQAGGGEVPSEPVVLAEAKRIAKTLDRFSTESITLTSLQLHALVRKLIHPAAPACRSQSAEYDPQAGLTRTGEPQPTAEPAKVLVPTHESIAPVRRMLADKAVYLSDETIKELVLIAVAGHSCAEPEPLLLPDDMAKLKRFKETTDDDQSFDIPKDAMKRLVELGAISNQGFGRYSITSFGIYATGDGERSLPLKTYGDLMAESDARFKARMQGTPLANHNGLTLDTDGDGGAV